ncbi:MAG: glycosyltransferase family 2 protein [Anaerolineales bacterium]
MRPPRISVLIALRDKNPFLQEALESLRMQSFQSYEAIVLMSNEVQHSTESLAEIKDPRITQLIIPSGSDLPAMMCAGIRRALGEYVTVMSSSDRLHPEKLQEHVRFLDANLDIGATCSGSIELDQAGRAQSIRSVPRDIDVSAMLPDIPFTLGDLVTRKEWLVDSGLAHRESRFLAGDLPAIIWLALAGCRFAGLERALTDRRCWPSNCSLISQTSQFNRTMKALIEIFEHPRCSREFKSSRNAVIAHSSAKQAFHAFRDNDISLGQRLIRQAIRHDHSLIGDLGKGLLILLALESTRDGEGHEAALQCVFDSLPDELRWVSARRDWAVALGYFWRGVWSLLWQRHSEAQSHLALAAAADFRLDDSLLDELVKCLLSYAAEVSPEQSREAVRTLARLLRGLASRSQIRYLLATFFVNQAFADHHSGHHATVAGNVLRALYSKPLTLMNRGVEAMLVKSLLISTSKSSNKRRKFDVPRAI